MLEWRSAMNLLIVDDEYLWNMDDQVGLIMPEEKMKFQLKK